jgi:hypothetical protein
MSVVDNESDKKFRLKEIVDMLVVGGYFRARLPALTPFDRGFLATLFFSCFLSGIQLFPSLCVSSGRWYGVGVDCQQRRR